MIRVLTIGTFDLLHRGHLELFNRCAAMGELFVGVNSDKFVHDYKGHWPTLPEVERLFAVRALANVAGGVVHHGEYEGATAQMIETMAPNVLAVGSDWARRDYYAQIDIDQDWLDARDITLAYVPRTPDISSSTIRKRLTG